jgi:O-succinylbenzoate synthase
MWQYTATMKNPVAAADEHHAMRRHLFIEIDSGEWSGWGEISPQPQRLNGDPSFDDVVKELTAYLLPSYVARVREEGAPVSWSRLGLFGSSRRESLFAVSGLEMAALDLELKESRTNMLEYFGESASKPPMNATWSLIEPDMDWSPPMWCDRLRVKTKPGIDVDNARSRLASWGLPVVLDFNCSGSSIEDVLRQIDQLESVVNVVAIEQPFTPSDLIAHAQLRSQMSLPLSLDESVSSMLDVRRIAQYEAADMICVKPARVGGFISARAIIDEAKRQGLRHYVGGFFETPLARSFNKFLASITGAEASDVGFVEFESEEESWDMPSGSAWMRSNAVGTPPDPRVLELLNYWEI